MGDLEQLGATNLIGTNFVKPYMHGFFMDWKLYKKLKSVSDPFAYENYVEERKQEKFKKLFGDRIVVNRNKNKTKVNNKLAEVIDQSQSNILKDDRFKDLFENKDYEIDFDSELFKKNKISANKLKNKEESQDLKHLSLSNTTKENISDKIVNPELIKLKEKLLAKKRKKIDKLYGSKEEDLEMTLENRIQNENSGDDEFEIKEKINKMENKNKLLENKKIKPKITQKKNNSEKRILANNKKLVLAKIK